MKRYSYAERDYAFGQRMLTLRTRLGLTQAGLAALLGVSRRAVSEWESGSNYPTAGHLQHLLELGVRQRVFAPGREEEEIRTLWQAAHQKVLLDEAWLSALLKEPSAPPAPVEDATGAAVLRASAPGSLAQEGQPADSPLSSGPDESKAPSARGPRVDWGDALDVPTFYGREEELATLAHWVVQERRRLVSVLGLGGVGKSALTVTLMRQVAERFQVVIWRSLRDAPAGEALLADCLRVLSPQQHADLPASLEALLGLLLKELREQRVLLVFDNLESVLEAGEARGRLSPGYEDYAQLLQRVAQTAHQSCLLFTSREKPAVLRALEGPQSPVRSLRLSGLEALACEQLLAEYELVGSHEERVRLVERYQGNPLALTIVAATITDLFGGMIGQFLAQDTLVFGTISDLLDEHWGRLSPLEQTLLYWLAILHEPVTLQELQAVQVGPLAPMQMLEAVDGLRRRSLAESGQRAGSFTLQSVVLEYVTDRLVTTAKQEIEQGRLRLLREHGLSQAQAREYVRQTQERLLLTPLLDLLRSVYWGRVEVEERLRELLSMLRPLDELAQGYGPANLVSLLRLLRGNLHGLDLSGLVLRGVYLQGIELQDANLSGSLLQESVLTETFDGITAVANSPDGRYWAASSRRGEVWVWESGQEVGLTMHQAWRAHTHVTYALAFSPRGRLLASGSWDGTLKLWDVESGALLWSIGHPGAVCLAFAPDGRLLASGGLDGSMRLWDAQMGTLLEEVPHPGPVYALAWSPDGYLLASGDFAGTLRLWEGTHSRPVTGLQTLSGHSNGVRGLAFAPDGSILASASWDSALKLWEVEEEGRLRVRQTLVGHTEKVHCLAWSPDGGTLASGSFDHTIRLWDGKLGTSRAVLQGHTDVVNSLAFTADGRLLSGSDDGTLRLWDVESFELLRVLEGYAAALFSVDWSPDGTRLASAGSEAGVTIWEVERRAPPGESRRDRGVVYTVVWSPDGRWLASSTWDDGITLWDASTATHLQVLHDPDHADTIFYGVAWSPDGKLLAGGTSRHGVQVWEMKTGSRRWASQQVATWIRHLAWSPDGARLVGGGNDGQVYVWEATNGTLLRRLAGHQGVVTSLAWSPDGSRLASVGRIRGNGELLVWDARRWQPVRALAQQGGAISAADWSADGSRLVSGGSDGQLCWWQVESGEPLWMRQAHTGTIRSLRSSPDGRTLVSCGDDGAIMLWDLESGEHLRTLRRDRPYERLNITGIRGLSDAQRASLRALGAFEGTSRDE